MGSHQARELQPLAGRTAVVSGASSGIGRALVVALSREGARVYALGRNHAALADTVAAAQHGTQVSALPVDLTVEGDLQGLLRHLEGAGSLDILIHCAGAICQAPMGCARAEDFDLQFSINVRAPYRMTQLLLPLVIAARGQIVFINSSVGLAATRPDIGQYAATKHALRAIADSLREEVNPKGVRVLSAYLGRTATPMQKAIVETEGKIYCPETLLQPEDVASTILHTLMLPPTAEVTEIIIRPMRPL
jgi:NAD(P)-dependent dehydrogenase (short-subunit alcohol dehydrogenase family)